MMDDPAANYVDFFKLELSVILWGLLKTLAFMAITIFMLCIPLGDPNKICTITREEIKYPNLIYLCDLYQVVSESAIKSVSTLGKVTEFSACVFVNALYDTKLKFYNLLEKLDKRDLCRSVSCENVNYKDEGVEAEGRVLPPRNQCKCRGKCCRVKNNQL